MANAQTNSSQLFQAGTPTGISNVTRDANGQLTAWVENGFAMSVTRTAAGLPLRLVAAGPKGRLVQTFSFDANGRLSGLTGDMIPTEFAQELQLGVPALLASASQAGMVQSLVSGDWRAPARLDPSTRIDGAISGVMDTGQVLSKFSSPTSPSPLVISGGVISHTPYAGANSAGYIEADLGGRITRIGCMAAWASGAGGAVALVAPSGKWDTGVLPNAGLHLVVYGNGIWTLTRFTTGGSTTLASNSTHGRPQTAQGLGYVPIDVWIDYLNGRIVIEWWDGTTAVVSSAYFTSETGNYAVWELYESDGTSTVPATMGLIWASAGSLRGDAIFNPVDTAVPHAAAPYSASGTLAPDFAKALCHEITLTGNVTSVAFTAPKNRAEIIRLELVQDATGSRTAAGWNASIKWAGGSAPTLSTTAAHRDIFTFRWDGVSYWEQSRSMNVG